MWLDGTYYDGEWENDMRHGKGEFVRFDGYYYEGGWENDKKHGEGVEHDENKTKSTTTWINGVKDGPGKY